VQALRFYRHFIGCRPDPVTRGKLAAAGSQAGQHLRADLYHLTFCVIAESRERDPSLPGRVGQAFAGAALNSAPIPFGRVVGGPLGAMARTIGRQDALQDLYQAVVRRLARYGFEPMHRKSGFRPHATLGHAACPFARFDIALEWIPDELLLIESEVGLTRHNVLGRWPLLPPRQARFDFAAQIERPTTGAAGPARRSAA